jgi:nucleoside-triphosphatase
VGRRSPCRVGTYGVDVAAFEREVVPLLDVRRGDVDLFVADEVGKMECFSAASCAAVERLLDDPRPIWGTIALGGPDVELPEVTPANREGLAGEIVARLRRWLNSVN